MASALNVARLAALIAIFGFFLPWAEVSCSGQPLEHDSGVQLITGGGAAPAHHDLWVAASLALVVLGLAGGMLLRGQGAALILAAGALAAALTSLIGVSQEVPNAEVQAQLAGGPSAQTSGAVVSAKLEYGYFVTLGGLVVAIAAAGMALAGQRSMGREPE
jgi:hypothetical protein